MTITQSDPGFAARPHLIRSLIAVIVGSLLLRAAAGAMGENIQFYFNSIDEAAQSLDHPLRALAGIGNVYEISYALGGIIIGAFFAAELIGAPLFGADGIVVVTAMLGIFALLTLVRLHLLERTAGLVLSDQNTIKRPMHID